MDMNIMIRQIEEDASTFHMHQSASLHSTGNARKPPRHACLGAQSTSKKTRSGTVNLNLKPICVFGSLHVVNSA